MHLPEKGVYTVITGGYDRLLDPLVLNKEWDYFCITDNEAMESKVWKVIPYPDDDSLDAARKNRKAKLLPWEFLDGYDYSLYIDGNIQITGDLTEWINWYAGKSGMLCFPHGVSNGLSDELELIQQHREKYYDDARRQAENYLSEGYPDNYPMVVASILLRDHHDPLLKKTMEDWWNEVLTKSGRDQISFGYANWKNGFVYDLCELDIYDNPYFSVKSHR
ncbi:MAG: DUF616 domain-containing protein [Lachnospiraceae bacterium]|nr:DUF616 domain-containing protein [Lachnospiraceae bacterium]